MREVMGKLISAADRLARYGWRGLLERRRWRSRRRIAERKTAEWLLNHGRTLTGSEIESLRQRIERFSKRPVISIIMPVYDVDERWLRRAIESVLKQVYGNWELCIADDHSPSPHVRRVLDEFAARDARIRVVYRESNGHISAASNSALELATGEYTALLDHDDELTEDALFHVVSAINDDPSLQMMYSDEDVIDEDGQRRAPKLKPSWSRDLFYSVNYVTHFAVYRTAVLKKLGGFRVGFEGSQDYDLALRVIEEIDERTVAHIPHILYHWRAIRGSVALSGGEKPYAHDRARTAIREHFARTGLAADVVESEFDLHRVIYRLPEPHPAVSVILSGAGKGSSGSGKARDVAHVEQDVKQRAESLNRAVSSSSGDVLVFLDGDLSVSSPGKIEELVGAAMQTGIGAVGGRIIGTDGIVEQAGIVLQADLSPAFAHTGFPREVAGNVNRNLQIGNVSAISISCFAIRRAMFNAVNGFDGVSFPFDLFDVDLCLKLWELGKRIVVLPHVEFVRQGSGRKERRSNDDEFRRLRERWPKYAVRDPFCNPNLKRDGSFEIDV